MAFVGRLIESWDTLPRAREFHLQEEPWFDLKETYPPGSQSEMAKDVAAFANGIGGALIVGAREGATGPDYSHPLSPEYASKLANEFDEAIRNFCRPSPTVHIRLIPARGEGEHVVLVVNVEPYIDQPVGVRHKTDKDAWRFPQRIGCHTEYILPEQLPVYMNAKARRAKLLLLRVWGAGGQIELFAVPPGSAEHTHLEGPVHFLIKSVDEGDSGAVLVADTNGTYDHQEVAVPIDDVEAVWLQRNGRWAVRISGRFELLLPTESDGMQELAYIPPDSFVASPLGTLVGDLSKQVQDLGKILRGTLVVEQHASVEPSEAAIAERAHQLWSLRKQRNTLGSAEADWFQARRQLIAQRRAE